MTALTTMTPILHVNGDGTGDVVGLQTFAAQLKSPGTANFSSWWSGQPPCFNSSSGAVAPRWLYVNCTTTLPGRVSSVKMASLHMVGTIASELALVDALEALIFDENRLSGTLPSELALLTSLTLFYIYSNNFNGPFPTFFWDGPAASPPIVLMRLSNNEFTGTIPTEIATLQRLEYVNIRSNKLEGSIPSEFGLLRSLQHLYMYQNKFSGTLPSELGLITTLSDILVNHNSFSGLIPSEIGLCSNLVYLEFHHNALSGSVPSEIGLLRNLQHIYLYGNNLDGSLPAEFGALTQLTSICIFQNAFSGTLPAGLANFSLLETFYAYVNLFNGSIPLEWQHYPALSYLDITHSGLTCSFCDPVRLWIIETLADSFIITRTASVSSTSGIALGLGPTLQISNYADCALAYCGCTQYGCCTFDDDNYCLHSTLYSPPVLLPSFVVTAHINPAYAAKAITNNVIASIEGIADFSNLNFAGIPNFTYTITFTAPGLHNVSTRPFTLPSCDILQPNSVQDPADPFTCICNPGFYFDPTGRQCLPCPLNTYKNSSLELSCTQCPALMVTLATASSSASQCLCRIGAYYNPSARECIIPCPEGINCFLYPTNDIIVLPGYWRSGNHTADVVLCPGGVQACLGSNISSTSSSLCTPQYSGVLCSVCAPGFTRNGPFHCTACPPRGLSSFFFFLACFISFLFIFFLVKSSFEATDPRRSLRNLEEPHHHHHHHHHHHIETYSSWRLLSRILLCSRGIDVSRGALDAFDINNKDNLTGLLKVILAYFQGLTTLGALNVKWPSIGKTFFFVSSQISLTVDLVSFDCDFSISYYTHLDMVFLGPVVIALGLAGIFFLHHRSHKRMVKQSLDDYQLTLMIVLSLFHPYFFQEITQTLGCMYVAGTKKSFLLVDMRVDCSTPTYHVYKVASVFFLIFYVVGLMLLLSIRGLFHNAKSGKLFDPTTAAHRKYRYFLLGYKHQRYYWEILMMARKMGLIFVVTVFSVHMQIILSLVILHLSLLLTLLLDPFKTQRMTILDSISLVLQIIVAIVAAVITYATGDSLLLIVGVIVIFLNGCFALILLNHLLNQIIPLTVSYVRNSHRRSATPSSSLTSPLTSPFLSPSSSSSVSSPSSLPGSGVEMKSVGNYVAFEDET